MNSQQRRAQRKMIARRFPEGAAVKWRTWGGEIREGVVLPQPKWNLREVHKVKVSYSVFLSQETDANTGILYNLYRTGETWVNIANFV